MLHIVLSKLADAPQQMIERWIALIQECWDEEIVKMSISERGTCPIVYYSHSPIGI